MVRKITQEFTNYAIFSDKIQPQEEDIWLCELHSVTFLVGTVSNQSCGISQKQFNNIWHTQMKIHQENQTEIIEKIMDIKNCNLEWSDQVERLLSRKTNTVQKLLSIVSTVPDESS